MNNKEDKKLNGELLALFLFVLKYSSSKEFKSLLHTFKQHRNNLKSEVNKIYAKYTQDGKLAITSSDINKEVKVIEKQLKTIGRDLRKQEDEMLTYLLYKVYKDTYNKSNSILSKYKGVDEKGTLKDKTIKDSINKKIADKTIFDRNKINKEKFITKVKADIKQQLQKGSDIGLVNKTIDKTFGQGAYVSERLLYTEVAREFNNSLLESYKANNIEKVKWNSTLEQNTCSECASKHGEIFNVNEVDEIPLHSKCNCWYEPIL